MLQGLLQPLHLLVIMVVAVLKELLETLDERTALHLLVILVVAFLVFGPQRLPTNWTTGGTPKHPLPVTGDVETSRGVKTEPPPDKPKYF